MKKDYSDAIDEVIDGFNFEQVHAYMQLVGWVYHDHPGTPSILRLKANAHRLLESLPKKSGYCQEGGGFRASFNGSELSLEFIPLSNSVFV